MKLNKTIATLGCGLVFVLGLTASAFAGGTSIVSGIPSAGGTVITVPPAGGPPYTSGQILTDTSVSYSSTVNGTYGSLSAAPSGTYLGGGNSAYAVAPFNQGGVTWPNALTPPKSDWITPYVNTTNDNATSQVGSGAGYYKYSTVYSLGAGQTQWTLNLNLQTQGQTITSVVFGGTALTNLGNGLWAGSSSTATPNETLTIVTDDTAGSRTGVDWSGSLVPEPATIAAFIIAMLGIAAMMIKARKGHLTTTLA
jgi:hypothetical protein